MKNFFIAASPESMIRLCTFLITVTSCLAVLAGVYQVLFMGSDALVDKLPIFIIPFLMTGLGAKVAQKRLENNHTTDA